MKRRRAAPADDLPAWTPFRRAIYPAEQLTAVAAQHGAAVAEVVARDEVWRNSRFQVVVTRGVPNGFGDPLTWLSIKTLQPPRHRHDWRELQRVKNELCGPECEALELYPAEGRLHDSADQFHLWVFPAGLRLPLGFAGRLVSDAAVPGSGSQRPFEQLPAGLRDAALAPGFTRWQVDERR